MTVMVEPAAAKNIGESAVSEQRSHPLLGQVETACERVRSAAATAAWGLSDADLESAIDACERLRARAHHLELGLIGEADGRALATRMGATSTTAWLRHRFRIRPGHAKSLVHTANAVIDPDDEVLDYAASVTRRTGRELVETGRALAQGLISPEHAATVDKIMGKVPREVSMEQATQAESDLAEFCREFDPGTVARLGDYLLEMMRTDSIGLESLAATQGDEPDSGRTEPSGDERTGDGTATPGEASPLGGASGGEAGQPTGRTGHRGVPAGKWVDRPLPRWATRDGGGVAPAQLVWGSHISAGTTLRMTCHSSVQRVLLDPAGAVLDVGRERRTVTPAQYAALTARDAGCAFPGCTRPPAWCIAHHIVHWAHGGPTNLDNLVMLCGHHHRVIHHGGWHVHVGEHDSLPTFIPPRWIDPDQQPRRNTRPRLQHSGDKWEVTRSLDP